MEEEEEVERGRERGRGEKERERELCCLSMVSKITFGFIFSFRISNAHLYPLR